MSDLISRQDVNDALEKVASFFPYKIPGKGETYDKYNEAWNDAIGRAEMEIESLSSAHPERKKDIIQNFHDYQVEWLKSHYDIELEPELEMLIVRFLNDTADCYIMEIER